VPFLITSINCLASLMLRQQLQEPQEPGTHKHQQQQQQGSAQCAAAKSESADAQRYLNLNGFRPGGASRKQDLVGVTRSPGDAQAQYEQQQKSYYMQKYDQQQQAGCSGLYSPFRSLHQDQNQEQVVAMNTNLRVRSTSRSPDTGSCGTSTARITTSDTSSGSCIEVSFGSTSSGSDPGSISNNCNSRVDEFGRLKVLTTPFGAPAVQFGRWLSGTWANSSAERRLLLDQLQQPPKQQLYWMQEAWGSAWGQGSEGVAEGDSSVPVVLLLVRQYGVMLLLQVLMVAW
jgi:hypothetical protein